MYVHNGNFRVTLVSWEETTDTSSQRTINLWVHHVDFAFLHTQDIIFVQKSQEMTAGSEYLHTLQH